MVKLGRIRLATCAVPLAVGAALLAFTGYAPRAGATSNDGQLPDKQFSRALVLEGSDTALRRYPEGKFLPRAEVCLKEGERLVVLTGRGAARLSGPGCTDPGKAAVKLADMEDDYFVYNGSPHALDRFPRGSLHRRWSKFCLSRGEHVTLITGRGLRVTYFGPGCNKRTGPR